MAHESIEQQAGGAARARTTRGSTPSPLAGGRSYTCEDPIEILHNLEAVAPDPIAAFACPLPTGCLFLAHPRPFPEWAQQCS